MGSRRGGTMELGGGYNPWNGVSGVPGLGNSLRQHSQLIRKDWNHHHNSLTHFSTEKHGGVLKNNLKNSIYDDSSSSSASSLVARKLSCHNCGYSGSDAFPDSLSGDEKSHDSYSSLESITSTNSIASMLDKCLHIQSKQTPIQLSRSLNYLPYPQKLTTSSMMHNKYTATNSATKHRKLDRAKGANALRPRVTFSEFTENINVLVEEHKQLSKKENILKVNNNPKSILLTENKYASDTSKMSTEDETVDSEIESESHYKTLKVKEDNYSYAYRDAFSPALMIKQGAANCSEYSEDIYEVIEHPDNNEDSKPEAIHTSVTNNDPENPFFLSISKGRRNHLKLHKFVDWDLDSDIFPDVDGNDIEKKFQVTEEEVREVQGNKKDDKIARERRELFVESENEYLRYTNYKNIRASKMISAKRDKSQMKARGPEKDHLKIKQSISKKISSIPFFTQSKERKLNFRKTFRKKWSSMVTSMMNMF